MFRTAIVLAGVLTLFAAPVVAPADASARQAQQTDESLVNLNTATAAELESLPGIGATIARRILEYREKNGGFQRVEDLMNVQGIGERSFLRLRPLVTVTPPTTDRSSSSGQ